MSAIAARASHAAQVQSRVKKLEKIERVELPPEQKVMRFEFAEPPRSGDDVVRLQDLGKTWCAPEGGEREVFRGVTGLIRRQEKIAVVGVNGAGRGNPGIRGQADYDATTGCVGDRGADLRRR